MKRAQIISRLPQGCRFAAQTDDVAFITVPGTARGRLAGLRPAGIDRWMALRRTDYWMHPVFGRDWSMVPSECQFLIGSLADGRFCALIPLVTADSRCAFAGGDDGITLLISRDGRRPADQPLVAIGIGDDADALVERIMAVVAERIGGFRLRVDKATPNFLDRFGWCTWDAFYHSVDERKVRAGLKSFADQGLRCGFMILDDGWADTNGDYLRSFATNSTKFPKGLAATIAGLKRDFGLASFGLWHCFESYWAGLDTTGPLAKEYRTHHSRARIRPWLKEHPYVEIDMIDPADIGRFYRDWYAILRRAGVDMVKVDGQSALDLFTDGLVDTKLPRVASMTAYQEAFQANGLASFRDGLLHCMSLSNDVLFRLHASNAVRNSDDYFPTRPRAVQQRHLWLNAYNAMFTQSVAWPDWDMFQSHGPCAAAHAMGRAISGGPVYVCDKPGKQDAALLRRLVCSDGSVPRFDRPARVSRDRVVVDTSQEAKLLKVHNRSGERAALAAFHCQQESDAAISDGWRVADVPGLERGRYAVWAHEDGSLRTVGATARQTLSLEPGAGEVFSIAPIRRGMAVIGLLDLYGGCAAVLDDQAISGGRLVRVQDGGRFGCWSAAAAQQVLVDGKAVRMRYDQASGLLTVTLKPGPHLIEIRQG